jgi:histidinol phosphatase-like enzyme
MRRIGIDLDGTICPIRRPEQSYDELTPNPGAAERIKELRRAGYYIIIITAETWPHATVTSGGS